MFFGQRLHSEDLNSFHFGLYSDWKVEKKSTEGHIVIKNHQEGWGGFIEPPLKTAVQAVFGELFIFINHRGSKMNEGGK